MENSSGLVRLALVVCATMVGLGTLLWATGLGGAQDDDTRDRRGVAEAALEDTPPAKGGGAGGDGACTLVGTPTPLPDAVHEASGLALGRSGVLWTHSDAGPPRVVAVSPEDGRVLGEVRIAGAQLEDWEDIAAGPCPEGSCLFIGDIGDNDAARSRITVYRVPEPAPTAGTSARATALHATYPDGAQDAEALFVDGSGRVHVLTKGETGAIAVYRFPASPGEASRLERIHELATGPVRRPERITGASASPDGRRVALRTLTSVSVYPMEALTGGGRQRPTRFDVSSVNEPQGEGIALGPERTIYLASEGGRKRNPATLATVRCPLPE